MTYPKESFGTIFYKRRFIIALILSIAILLLNGCVKKILENQAQDYFESNFLNTDFVVDLATNDTADITAQYNGYVYRLLKNTLSDGPMTAVKNGITYTGTWSTNEDYSKLIVSFTEPGIPSEFIFLNRQWRFTSKQLPVLKFAPWGSTAPIVLHMRKL